MPACNPLPTSYPALTLLTFEVTFCVTFHLTNTVVHECSYDENGTRRQDIEIYYSFVGKVDLLGDYPKNCVNLQAGVE